MEKRNPDPNRDVAASAGEGGNESPTYCVTGATGYIGSWLVKSLLQRGFSVHATARNPDKFRHLLTSWGGGDRLKLFKADLYEDRSFDEAVGGCDGVFHVAASMEFTVPPMDNLDDYVQLKIIQPSVKGTINVLKSCSRSKSVKRVVFTSSISTMTAKTDTGQWVPIVDESCQIPMDVVWNKKTSGWVYVLAKHSAEEAAFQFAKENSIPLVSVITTTVGGPFLTSTVPSSIRVLLSPITGDPEFLPILSSVNSRMGSIALVHIEDVCNAHIHLMQHDSAQGRYICCTDSCTMHKLICCLSKAYPDCPNIARDENVGDESVPTEISSKKLRDLGFACKYRLEDVMRHTVEYCIEFEFLAPTQK